MGIIYPAGFELVINHIVPLAFVFDSFTIHARLSTNSVHPGQDYPIAHLMIFFVALSFRVPEKIYKIRVRCLAMSFYQRRYEFQGTAPDIVNYTACQINVPKKGWRHKGCRKKAFRNRNVFLTTTINQVQHTRVQLD